uniref:Uncharacterized protein n=1 Tax=Mola mola TaxID=94237 RepID=A0A3Q3XNU6_MOLML
MQNRLQELIQIGLKKECSHQASQIDEMEEGKDYKSLFEKAKKKVNELIQDRESLLAISENMPSAVKVHTHRQIFVNMFTLLFCMLSFLLGFTVLLRQLNSLEEERADLASQCEELRLRLQQQRENAQERSTASLRATDSSVQTDPENAERTLRQNIGRLLVTHVPELDLGQVNFECNVIDEILEQFLPSVESSS